VRFEGMLTGHAMRRPGHSAVVTEHGSLSYAELYDDASRLAASLIAMGIKPNDRVALYLPNSPAYLQAFFGILLAGAVVVPISTWLTPQEMAFCIDDSDAKALFIGREQAVSAAAQLRAWPGYKIVVGDDPPELPSVTVFSEALSHLRSQELPELSVAHDDCLVLYTSGTTGRPKAAVLTHANMVVTGLVNGLGWKLTEDDRFLAATPLANRTGTGRIINAFTLGGTLCVLSAFEPKRWVSFVDQHRVTVAGSVPTMWKRLLPVLEENPGSCASLRTILLTGEAFPPELNKRLRTALPHARLISFFGMTETGAVAFLEGQDQIKHPSSVGRPFPGVEVKIVDERDLTLEPKAIGELLVRAGKPGSTIVFKGYANNPSANRDAFLDDWFRTGDLGYIDDDGYVFIVDRKKDMIVSGGSNIYSKEVEEVVNRYALVSDSAVVGVPDPDYGEAVAVFVELRDPNVRINAEDIIAHCRAHIASYKKPRHVFVVDQLPRNSIGKVLKKELSEIARLRLASIS
jgi:long-chain acyl-CoA synthetase